MTEFQFGMVVGAVASLFAGLAMSYALGFLEAWREDRKAAWREDRKAAPVRTVRIHATRNGVRALVIESLDDELTVQVADKWNVRDCDFVEFEDAAGNISLLHTRPIT